MLWANIDAADRMDESAELITAAEMAPRPIVETKGGVRCCSTSGRIFSGLKFQPLIQKLQNLGMGRI